MLFKKIFVIVAIIVACFSVQGQKNEKSFFGIQAGFLGSWVYGEFEVLNKISVRSEVGVDIGAWGDFYQDKPFAFSSPVFTVEPRWYSKEKRNKGIFFALKTSYTMDWFDVANRNEKMGAFQLIPSIGLRRAIGKHFDYEIGAGYGFQRRYTTDLGYSKDLDNYVPNIRLRLGFHL